MKLLQKSGASRMAPLLIAAFGLAASSLHAATNVTIGLSGKTFGHNQPVSAESTGLLDPSEVYTYTLQGTLKGNGALAGVEDVALIELARELRPGDSSPLSGRKSNPLGTLPVTSLSNKTYEGLYYGLMISLTISSEITATGQVIIDIKNISIKSLTGDPIKGSITFGSGSSLVVTTAPTFRTHQEVKFVKENIGTVNVKVERWGYVGAATSVKVQTSDGTAKADVDYTAKSVRVKFAAGETSKIVPIKIINNSAKDKTREFKVTLSAPAAGSALDDRVQTLVKITNED